MLQYKDGQWTTDDRLVIYNVFYYYIKNVLKFQKLVTSYKGLDKHDRPRSD